MVTMGEEHIIIRDEDMNERVREKKKGRELNLVGAII